jgi:hypothetical protein
VSAVAKNFRNVPQVGSLLKHAAGQGVPEEMGGDLLRPINPRADHAVPHNMADARGARERHTRSVCAQEDLLGSPNAPIQTQITRHRGADLAWQWQDIQAGALASDQDLTCSPADVA